MAERGLKARELGLSVISDPSRKLYAKEFEMFHVTKLRQASVYGGTYEDYDEVEPAMLVVDGRGKVVQQWSWKTMHIRGPLAEDTPAIGSDGTKGFLVQLRPDSLDILPSIQENREARIYVYSSLGKMILTGLLPGLFGQCLQWIGCRRLSKKA